MFLKAIGPTTLDYWKLYHTILKHNGNFEHLILDAYYDLADTWDMDASALIAQAIHETGWFTSYRAVKNHNYAGIGATSDTVLGQASTSVIEGVQRHYSHLHAYAGKTYSLKARAYDDRYDIVWKMRRYDKPIITYMEELGGRWAPASDYGYALAKVYEALRQAA